MKKSVRDTISGYAFLAPNILGFLSFNLFPVAMALVLGFFQWDILTDPKFIGLGNYERLLGDGRFWTALINTGYYTVVSVPAQIIVALTLAVLLNQKIRGRGFYRMLYFLPVVTSWVAVALLFKWLYNPDFGLINYLLSLIGIPGLPWLSSPVMAMPSVILTTVWKNMGYYAVIFLAGLQGIPGDLMEAADIDGANAFQRFFRISLPMLTPTIFFVVVVSLINSFQVFEQVMVMTEGGPMDSTNVLVYYIYANAFQWFRMGYAISMAWILFVIIFSLTLVQIKTQNKWVFYQ